MVIADAESPGPVRKRAKLSLKPCKKDNRSSSPSTAVVKNEPLVAGDVKEDLTDKNSIFDGDGSYQDSSVVPAVTSLQNMGNTCFLNSVLQILRYTPGFLDRLDDLYQELIVTEKLKIKDLEEDDSDDEDFKLPLTSELVKFLHDLYMRMDRREGNHNEVATADVMSMAIRPERILNTIRELNPMFEGYMQHDAQELLRCILCYLQDAEKDIIKLKQSIQPKLLNGHTSNSFVQNGTQSSDKSYHPDKINSVTPAKNDIFQTMSSYSSPRKVEPTLQMDTSEAATISNDITSDKIPECQIADVALMNNVKRDGSGDHDFLNVKRQRKPKLFTQDADENRDTKEEKVDENQPSILTMLKPNGSCKRLGMRGAIVKGKTNINCSNNCSKTEENCRVKELYQGKSALDSSSEMENCSSVDQYQNGKEDFIEKVGKCNPDSKNSLQILKKMKIDNSSSPHRKTIGKKSPLKAGMPFVKLEKCDHVCDSPKKSVSATMATKTLSPMKLNSPRSRISTAIAKLDFTEKRYMCKKSEKKKKDFVEKLFMGTLMLRTRCTECEFSREKIEEFHDISVAVQKEKKDDSDTEDGDQGFKSDEEEEKDHSSLPKLLESFSEVERLRGDNKYFCDKCQHLVEAERSLHYNVLPDILCVHLKRFSASSGLFGYASKINDHVRIPLFLPCLRHKCPRPCSRADHRYQLYGLIAHAGVTLTSGHYLTYVKVKGNQLENHVIGSDEFNQSPSKSYNRNSHLSLESQSQKALVSSPASLQSRSPSKFVLIPSEKYEGSWLECDDEAIKVHSEEEFCQMLKGEEGSLLGTPYVLFYHKVLCPKI